MNEVIEKTYELLDYLDNSKIVKDLTTAKNKLLNNQDILKKIKKYQKEKNITLKKEIFNNPDYDNYMQCYNELSYLVMDINKKIKNITGKKECLWKL